MRFEHGFELHYQFQADRVVSPAQRDDNLDSNLPTRRWMLRITASIGHSLSVVASTSRLIGSVTHTVGGHAQVTAVPATWRGALR